MPVAIPELTPIHAARSDNFERAGNKGTLGLAAGTPMPGGPRTEAIRLVTGLDVCGGWPAGLMGLWTFLGLVLALALLLGY